MDYLAKIYGISKRAGATITSTNLGFPAGGSDYAPLGGSAVFRFSRANLWGEISAVGGYYSSVTGASDDTFTEAASIYALGRRVYVYIENTDTANSVNYRIRAFDPRSAIGTIIVASTTIAPGAYDTQQLGSNIPYQRYTVDFTNTASGKPANHRTQWIVAPGPAWQADGSPNMRVAPYSGANLQSMLTAGADAVSNTQNSFVVSAQLYGLQGAAWDRLRLNSARDLLVAVNAALPAGTNVIGGVNQNGTWNIGTVTTLSQFPSAVALSDTLSNPTTTQVGANLLAFDGTNWQRARLESSTQLNVRVALFQAGNQAGVNASNQVAVQNPPNLDSALSTRLADSTFTGRFPATAALADATANPTLTQIQVFLMGFNGTTWDRLRSKSTGILRTSDENMDAAITTRLADSTFTGRFPSAVALSDAIGNPTTTNVASMLMVFDGTNWQRARLESSTQINLRVGLFQAGNQAGVNASNQVAVQNPPNLDAALSTRLADSTFTGRFPASAALSDSIGNPTTTQVGANLLVFDGTNWQRARLESSTQLNLRVGLFQSGNQAGVNASNQVAIQNPPNLDLALSSRLADSTFTGRFPAAAALSDSIGNPTTTNIAAMSMIFDGTNFARRRTARANTSGLYSAAVFTGFNGTGSGTTTDAYGTNATSIYPQGRRMLLDVVNTGGANGLTFRLRGQDRNGNYADSVVGDTNVGAGARSQQHIAINLPYENFEFDVKSQVAGSATTYQVEWVVTQGPAYEGVGSANVRSAIYQGGTEANVNATNRLLVCTAACTSAPRLLDALGGGLEGAVLWEKDYFYFTALMVSNNTERKEWVQFRDAEGRALTPKIWLEPRSTFPFSFDDWILVKGVVMQRSSVKEGDLEAVVYRALEPARTLMDRERAGIYEVIIQGQPPA